MFIKNPADDFVVKPPAGFVIYDVLIYCLIESALS